MSDYQERWKLSGEKEIREGASQNYSQHWEIQMVRERDLPLPAECLYMCSCLCLRVSDVCMWEGTLLWYRMDLKARTLNATPPESARAEDPWHYRITHIKVIIIRTKCQVGKSNNPCTTCNLFAVFFRSPCWATSLQLFGHVLQIFLTFMKCDYVGFLPSVPSIPLNDTHKWLYAWHSKQASTLDLKISVWKEQCCILMSTFLVIYLFCSLTEWQQSMYRFSPCFWFHSGPG